MAVRWGDAGDGLFLLGYVGVEGEDALGPQLVGVWVMCCCRYSPILSTAEAWSEGLIPDHVIQR